jgi:hypothetical protein
MTKMGDHTMREQPAMAREHGDLAGPYLAGEPPANREHVSGPDGGQHARAGDPHRRLAELMHHVADQRNPQAIHGGGPGHSH